MLRLRCLPLAILALLSLSAPAWGKSERSEADPARSPTVILISMDGVRHDFPARDDLPGFARMARDGARAEALVPAFPSLTFPSHVTMATGASVASHGIVANRFLDRDRGEFDYGADASWIRAEPLWIAAERQGVRAASFFWVGSETPWRGRSATYRRAPFSSRVGEAEKTEQILAWFDLPRTERPQLIMSWWHGADHAGHRYGPDAAETRDQLREQDERLTELLRALDERRAWAHTTLVVVSDHGMTAIRKGLDPRSLLAEAQIEAEVVTSTAFAHLFLDDSSQLERAMAVFEGRRRVHVYARDEIPSELRYAHEGRMGDLFLLLEPPLALGGSRGGMMAALQRLFGAFMRTRGGHGYRPEHPDMHGIFYAIGRGVGAGIELPPQRALDVAATAAALLGIEAPLQNEGRPISGLSGGAAETGEREAD